jgi:hypothetical protein
MSEGFTILAFSGLRINASRNNPCPATDTKAPDLRLFFARCGWVNTGILLSPITLDAADDQA